MLVFGLIFCGFAFPTLAQDFSLRQQFAGHQAPVSYVTFRSEDNLLISGDENGQLILWDVERGRIKKQLQGHQDQITHIGFNGKGDLMATASYDGTIGIWDLQSYQIIQVIKNTRMPGYANLKGHEPSFVTFSPNDQGVYYSGYNMEVLYTDFRSGQTKSVFKTREFAITCGTISPDEQHLVIAYGTTIRFIPLNASGRAFNLSKGKSEEDYVCEIAFQPSHQKLAAWANNGSIQFWDTQQRKLVSHLNATQENGSSNIAFSGNGRYLVSGNFGAQTKLWDLEQQRIIQIMGEHQAEVITFSFSIDGNLIVTGSKDHMVNLWQRQLPDFETPQIELPNIDTEVAEVKRERTLPRPNTSPKPRSRSEQSIPPPTHSRSASPQIVFIDAEGQAEEPSEEQEFAENTIPPPVETTAENSDEFVFDIDDNIDADDRTTIADDQEPQKPQEPAERVEPSTEVLPAKDRVIETQHAIEVQNPEIELSFWDNQKVDGDSISVNINGRWVLNHYALKRHKKTIRVKLDRTDNYIIIHAHNEGSISPNTLALSLIDGGELHQYSLNSNMKKSGALKVTYDPKNAQLEK